MLSRIRSLLKPFKTESPKVERSEPTRVDVVASSGSSLAPVVVIACGAGVAFWWWTQWVRSREENPSEAVKGATAEPDRVDKVLGQSALDGLDESLAVQASATVGVAPEPGQGLHAPPPTLAA